MKKSTSVSIILFLLSGICFTSFLIYNTLESRKQSAFITDIKVLDENNLKLGIKFWKEYPNLKGQPSIDLENDLIAMISGTTCNIYRYSDLINNNKETLLYSFKFERYTLANGKYYTNGFAIKDGYLYEIRGCYGDNGIEVWDYSGNRIIYKDISLILGTTNEPQGIHIYNNKIYIGLTEFTNGSNWTYTVGYLE